jgi:hypothetical protein
VEEATSLGNRLLTVAQVRFRRWPIRQGLKVTLEFLKCGGGGDRGFARRENLGDFVLQRLQSFRQRRIGAKCFRRSRRFLRDKIRAPNAPHEIEETLRVIAGLLDILQGEIVGGGFGDATKLQQRQGESRVRFLGK